jgi:hypothetical protein
VSDKGPNWEIERLRLEATIADHDDTIEAGRSRKAAIERSKAANLRRAQLANMDLDAEVASIDENEAALQAKKIEIGKNLTAMAEKKKGDNV